MESVFAGTAQKKLGDKLQPYILTNFSIVITKKSINRFFGHTGQSDWLNEFMHGFSRYGLGATGLLEKLSNPILFQTTKKGGFPTIEEAYSVDTLIEASEFIIFAKKEGFLSVIELKFASMAETIVAWHHKSPFHHQIAEITGYNLIKWKAQQKIISTLSQQQKDAAYVWTTTFPETFWEILLAQTNTDWKQILKHPHEAARFAHAWTFARLKDETMDELRHSKPKRAYRTKKAPQKLETQALDAYFKLFEGMYRVADKNLGILDQLLSKTYPTRRTITLEAETKLETLEGFALQLREAVTIKQ